jgi:hypothetical protein
VLPRHPDTMTDEELQEWMLRLVRLREEESLFLDYKQTVSTDTRSDKREIAKDVSSFANERGGVILYGIPQDRDSDAPVPVDESRIGMEPIDGLREAIENILVDTLTPRLPELRIRVLSVPNRPDKVVYLVWHPESWEAPHMVHAYDERRFYRRGNFRAVPIEEGEVERLYRRRQSRRGLAEEFLEHTDFGEYLFPEEHVLLRIAVCPGLPSENRADFARDPWRDWLRGNRPANHLPWIPSIEGVRFTRPPSFRIWWTREYRLFRNGAASLSTNRVTVEDASEPLVSGLGFYGELVDFLSFVGGFYREMGMTGDTLIDIAFRNMDEVELYAGVPGMPYRGDVDYTWHDSTLQFRLPASATELLSDDRRSALTQRIVERFGQCFGLWGLAEGYDRLSSGS